MVINMKITVLAGGTSTERDVSLVTGSMIYKSLVKSGHQVVLVDLYLGYDGADYTDVFAIKKDWSESIQAISSQNPDIRQVRAMRKDDPYNEVGPHVIDICKQSDIVFLALHGQNGEDGKVQAMFDLLHIKYTGTDYFSSALAMDKVISKELFIKYDIPTPKGITLTVGQEAQWDTYPCIVKVNRGGSSVGVYKAENAQELQDALKQAFSFEKRVLIEEYIDGREFSIGVMDGKALPIIEIAPKVGFYDYKNKYQAGSTIETCPAEISPELTAKMQENAVKAAKALGLTGYSRLDFMMKENGDMYCLEANTLPGMTPTSLIPQEAKVLGMDYPTLCEELIRISLKKYE